MTSAHHEQILDLRGGQEPLFIQTPLGLIELQRVKEDGRKLRLKLPACCRAFRKKHEALETSPFLHVENGLVKPLFSLLSPVVNEQGELIDVAVPQTLVFRQSVKEPVHEHSPEPGDDPLADPASTGE